MTELTVGQLSDVRKILEQEAASLLGKMLFEFARLETALSLCIVWVDGGKRLETLTSQIRDFSFHKKIDFLRDFVHASLPIESEQHTAYIEWIEQVHVVRLRRNELVHGRWGIDASQEQVVNVLDIPTSPEQREVRYKLSDLQAFLAELQRQQTRLYQLRKKWPL